jgi:hypothetical protein
VPETIVDRILALAVRGKGTVAGIKLDPVAAKAALAKADEADAVVTAGKMLVRRAQDESSRQRASVAAQVSAIRVALRGYAKTAQGAPFAQEVDELASLTKQHKAATKALKTRTLKGAAKEAAAKGDAGSPPGTVPAETPAVKPATTPTAS